MVYFVITQSILQYGQYGMITWGGLGIVVSNTTITAQKSIVKIISKNPKTYSSIQLFKDFNVLYIQ